MEASPFAPQQRADEEACLLPLTMEWDWGQQQSCLGGNRKLQFQILIADVEEVESLIVKKNNNNQKSVGESVNELDKLEAENPV